MERIFRDARINRIIEGTSEIMRLFLAREALDPHIQLAFDMILPKYPLRHRLEAAVRAGAFYTLWYPRQWLPVLGAGAPADLPGRLRGHYAFLRAQSRRLARGLFHQMIRHQQRLEKRQMVLFRLVDVGVDLFAMGASISRAASLIRGLSPKGTVPVPSPKGTVPALSAEGPVELADLFCRFARRRVLENLSRPDRAEDRQNYRVAQGLLRGEYAWLEAGIVQ